MVHVQREGRRHHYTVNIPATSISVPLDFAAFGFALYDIWTSPCPLKKKAGLSFVSGANLTFGVGGQITAAASSVTGIGPPVIAGATSAVEATLYASQELAISQCNKE
jgi:hypothetical protein